MSASGPKRAERLLNLLQILFQHRYQVSGHSPAEELSVSFRTLYRDICALRAGGRYSGRSRHGIHPLPEPSFAAFDVYP